MDEDTVAIVILATIFVFLLSSPLLLTGCIAAFATRKWALKRHNAAYGLTDKADVEADRLVDSAEDDSDPETEFLDSEDEEYYNLRRQARTREREEREADLRLSTRAKFFKEWKKCWGGAGTVEQRKKDQEFKEQEQHRKIAREAVREYLRIERKKARKAARQTASKDEDMELPTYGNATKA